MTSIVSKCKGSSFFNVFPTVHCHTADSESKVDSEQQTSKINLRRFFYILE